MTKPSSHALPAHSPASDLSAKDSADLLTRERDLALALGATNDLRKALDLVLQAAMTIEPIDSAAVSLVGTGSEEPHRLTAHRGLALSFIEALEGCAESPFEAKRSGTQEARFYGATSDGATEPGKLLAREGIHALAILPIHHEGQRMALLYLASRTTCELPQRTRIAAESIAARIGALLARISADEALQKSERRYRTIFEESKDAIYVTDSSGNFLDINTATLDLFGYSREEIYGISAKRFYANEVERKRFQRELKTRSFIRDFELKLQRSDGTPMDCIVTVARWGEGDIASPGYLGIVRDISERKRAERDLEESKARYHAIVEDQTELICRFLPDGTFSFVNEALCRYFGKRSEDLLGTTVFPLVVEEDRQRVMEHIRSLGRERPVAACEHRVRLPNGEIRWQQWSDRAIFDEAHGIVEYQSVGRDITKRKAFEEALRQANEDLEKRVEARTSELHSKTRHLEEVNTALKVLLNQRETDRQELEETMVSNLKHLVFPYLDRLKRTRLDGDQTTYVSIIESHLAEIVSPFLKKLSPKYLYLTPAEIEIADLIKQGKSTKEISQILRISENTVVTHRYHLRSKLGLKNNKVNLRSYLRSLSDP